MYTSKIHNSPFKKVHLTFTPPGPMNMPIFFEVRGTNGSGKSTVPFLLQAGDPDAFKVIEKDPRHGELVLTCSPNSRTIIVGGYPIGRAVGGCDTISGAEKIEAHLKLAREYIKGDSLRFDKVFFEGIMTSTSNSRYTKFLVEELGVPQEQIVVGWCNTPLEACIERIYGRTGKEFNHDLVEGKHDQLSRQPLNHKELFPDAHRVVYDCMCSKEDMLHNWLWQKYEPVVL